MIIMDEVIIDLEIVNWHFNNLTVIQVMHRLVKSFSYQC